MQVLVLCSSLEASIIIIIIIFIIMVDGLINALPLAL